MELHQDASLKKFRLNLRLPDCIKSQSFFIKSKILNLLYGALAIYIRIKENTKKTLAK